MPMLPTAPLPLCNQPILRFIGNPSGNIFGNIFGNKIGNDSGNIVHLLTPCTLPLNNLNALHPIGNDPGNISGNTTRLITVARVASANGSKPENFTTRADHPTIAIAPANYPAKKRQAFRQYHQVCSPAPQSTKLDIVACSTHRRDLIRPPHSGNASTRHLPTTFAVHYHHHPPRTSQKRKIPHIRWQQLHPSAIARRGLGINVLLMYTCAGLASTYRITATTSRAPAHT